MTPDQIREGIRQQMLVVDFHEQKMAAAQSEIEALQAALWELEYDAEERERSDNEGEYWKRN